MNLRILSLAFVAISFFSLNGQEDNEWMKEKGFVFLDEILDNAIYEPRYHSNNNFVGQQVDGYHTDRLVLTKQAAKALKKAEITFANMGYGLKIFDTYRPQQAVNHFIRWSKDVNDTLTKAIFYPEQDKRNLFQLGYISTRSGHSRGSTIDLTLYHLDSGEDVDMGGPYDFFGEISHHIYDKISAHQKKHRYLLKSTLSECGFRAYSKEWWHYTLRNEPYPKTFFDHVVH